MWRALERDSNALKFALDKYKSKDMYQKLKRVTCTGFFPWWLQDQKSSWKIRLTRTLSIEIWYWLLLLYMWILLKSGTEKSVVKKC